MSNKTVFIHMDAVGARRGNGGFVMLAQLAQELSRMGYQVGVFDHMDRLHRSKFDWLSLGKMEFSIVPFQTVVESDAPFVACFLKPLLKDGKLIGGINPERLRYWSHGEILRDGHEESLEFVKQHCPEIAINNHVLARFYFDGVDYRGDLLCLDNWVRSDLFHARDKPRTVFRGTQSDNFVFNIYPELVKAVGENLVIVCEGTQAEVAHKMRMCRFYIHYNRWADCFKKVGLKGETFGMALFEAMACGCFVIARYSDAIVFLEQHIPVVSYIDEVILTLEYYATGAGYSDVEVRQAYAKSFIDEHYRWDYRREYAVREFLK